MSTEVRRIEVEFLDEGQEVTLLNLRIREGEKDFSYGQVEGEAKEIVSIEGGVLVLDEATVKAMVAALEEECARWRRFAG